MSRKRSPIPAHPGDFLIRKECPSCGVEISLDSSTLDRKIRCPKCRRTVVISTGAPVSDIPVAIPTAPPLENSSQFEEKETPVSRNRFAESMPRSNGQAHGRENAWIVYCLCNGIIKKMKRSGDRAPDHGFCLKCPFKDPLPVAEGEPEDVFPVI